MRLVIVLLCSQLVAALPTSQQGHTISLAEIKAATEAEVVVSEGNSFADVDIVYTWFNAMDKPTQDLKEQTLRAYDNDPDLAPDTRNPGRYYDLEELRYSLRSVERNAPWVRRIHIVIGDDQPAPAFLNLDHPKIRIVRHSEIFRGSGKLPTFNALAIESALHRVPDLADIFIYFNDDTLIGEPVAPTLFFQDKTWKPNVWVNYFDNFYNEPIGPNDTGHSAAQKNSQRLLRRVAPDEPYFDPKLFGVALHHQVKALSKRMLSYAEDKEYNAFRDVRQKQFRSMSTFSPIAFSSLLCIQHGDCINADFPQNSYYVNVNEYNNAQVMLETVQNHQFTLLCINDGDESVKDKVSEALRFLFPSKSTFEKD